MSDKYHVAFLTKTQQASLRGLLFMNLKQSFISSTLGVMQSELTAEWNSTSLSNEIGLSCWEIFKTYHSIAKRLITVDDLIDQKGKHKVISFTSAEMNMTLQSIDQYEKSDKSALSQHQRNLLAKDIDSLKDICLKASQYQYSHDEIRAAKEEK